MKSLPRLLLAAALAAALVAQILRARDLLRAQTILRSVDFAGRDDRLIGTPDPKIAGGPDILGV